MKSAIGEGRTGQRRRILAAILVSVVCFAALLAAMLYFLAGLLLNSPNRPDNAVLNIVYASAIFVVAATSALLGLGISKKSKRLRRMSYALGALTILGWIAGIVYKLVIIS